VAQLNPSSRIDDPALYATGIPHDLYDVLREGEPVHFKSGPLPFYAILRHAEALRYCRTQRLSPRRGRAS